MDGGSAERHNLPKEVITGPIGLGNGESLLSEHIFPGGAFFIWAHARHPRRIKFGRKGRKLLEFREYL